MTDLGHEVDGESTQGLRPDAAGSHGALQLRGGVGGELAGRSSGQQLGEEYVQPAWRVTTRSPHPSARPAMMTANAVR